MPVVKKWAGDGLSPGAITTSTAGTGDSAFSFASGASVVATGVRSPQIALADTAAAHQVRWWPVDLAVWGIRLYFSWASGTPSASIGLVHGYNASAAVFRIEMSPAGLLRLRNASAATWSQTTNPLVPGQRYRLELFGGSGSATLRIFLDESETPVINQTAAIENLSLTEIRFGRHVSASQTGFTMDDLAVADTAGEIGAVAPYVAPPPPTKVGAKASKLRLGAKAVVGLAKGDDVLWGVGNPSSGVPAGFAPFYSTDFSVNDGYTARTETQANDNSYNHPDNVAYTPEGLVITGKREERGGRPFTTGDVTGQHVEMPNYFRVDVDATLPTDYGMWPCPLWLRPLNSNNGGDGELDLCETWTFDWTWNTDKTVYSNAISYATMWRDYVSKDKQNASRRYDTLPNPDAGARHRYTLIKTPGAIEYQIDGLRVFRWQAGATYSSVNRIGPPPAWFDSIYEVAGQTWYPRFTLQLGGSQTADPIASWTESELVIHQMKIYVPA